MIDSRNIFFTMDVTSGGGASSEYVSKTYNPFEIYNNMQTELFGEESSRLDEETFNKILMGDIETDDILALSIIEEAKKDSNAEMSEEELYNFYEKIENREIEGLSYINTLSQTELFYNAQMEGITQKYLGKPAEECTANELNYSYALNMIDGILLSSQEGLKAQDDADGVLNELFDSLKEATGLGTCQEDVENALKKQEEIVTALKETLKNGGDFEAKWEELTGVKYDAQKIAQYQEKTTQLQFISLNVNKVSSFYDLLNSEAQYDPSATYDMCVEFYGEEKGKEIFCEIIKYSYNNTLDSGYDSLNPIVDVSFDDNGDIILTSKDNNTLLIGKPQDVPTYIFTPTYSDKFKNQMVDKELQALEDTLGVDYETLNEECRTLSNEALGDANTVTNLLNEYVSSQRGFIDTIGSIGQCLGIGLMFVGGVACFIPGANGFGMGAIKAGQMISIASTFGDEALEVIDTATNNNSWEKDKERYKEILKDTITDGALFLTGYGIGQVSGAFGEWLLTKAGSTFISKVGEIGVDASLSLIGDMVITGEIDLKGEGLSQFLSILTGTAMAHNNARCSSDVPKTDAPNSDIPRTNTPDDWDPFKGWEPEEMANRDLGRLYEETPQDLGMTQEQYNLAEKYITEKNVEYYTACEFARNNLDEAKIDKYVELTQNRVSSSVAKELVISGLDNSKIDKIIELYNSDDAFRNTLNFNSFNIENYMDFKWSDAELNKFCEYVRSGMDACDAKIKATDVWDADSLTKYNNKISQMQKGNQYEQGLAKFLDIETMPIEVKKQLLESGLSAEDAIASIEKLASSTYRIAMRKPNQYLSDIDSKYTTPVDGHYPQLTPEELAIQRAQVDEFFAQNIVKMQIALKYIDVDTLNQMMDKRTTIFAQSLDEIVKLKTQNLELVSDLIKCKSSDRSGKALSADEKMDLVKLLEKYQSAGLDTTVLRQMAQSGEVSVLKAKETINVAVLKRAGLTDEQIASLPDELKFNEDFLYNAYDPHYNVVHGPYKQEIFNTEPLYTLIREASLGNFEKFINDTSNPYGQANAATKSAFEAKGLDYDKWINSQTEPMEVTLGGKTYSAKVWDRNPQEDLFLGDKTNCCTQIGRGNGAAMPVYLMNTSFNVIKLYDDAGNVVAMSRVYFADVNGTSALCMDNFEIDKSALKGLSEAEQLAMRDTMFQYAGVYAQEVSGNSDTPVYISAQDVHTDTSSLESVPYQESTTTFIGDISQENIYINANDTNWCDPRKPTNITWKVAQ